jgi:hypothetical protein
MAPGNLIGIKFLVWIGLVQLPTLAVLAETRLPEKAQAPAAAASAPDPSAQPAGGPAPATRAPAPQAVPNGQYPAPTAPPGAWQPMPPGYPPPYPYPYPYYYPYPPQGCTPDGRCWGNGLPPPPDPAEARREAEYAVERRIRQEARERPRFSAGVELVLFIGDVSESGRNKPGPGFGLHAGFAQQLTSKLGLDARLGFMFAAVGVSRCSELGSDCSSSEASEIEWVNTVMMFHGEGSLFIGPFGRFYLAPGLWLGVRWFSKESAHTGNVTYNFHETGPVGGPLGRLGFFLGSKDQMNLYVAVRGDVIKDTSVSVVGGCSFSF